MNALEWIKSNVLIVVFAVIMVAAPVAMWFVASGMNESVKADVKKRADSLPQIKKIKDNTIEVLGLPPVPGVINERFIADYEKVAGVLSKDADAVRQAAIDHNRKGRDVLMRDVLPSMPPQQVEVLPKRFHEKLVEAYDALLKDVNAGSPPDLESLRGDLERTRSTFITQKLQMSPEEKLSEDQAKQLAKHLSERRLALYSTAADNVTMYATTEALAIPEWQQSSLPLPAQLFAWQWQYWIQSDVLKALAEANKADHKVYRAPVKQVYRVSVVGLPAGSSSGTSGSGNAGQPGGFSGGGGGGGRGKSGPGGDPSMPDQSSMEGGAAAGGAGGPNPKAQIAFDYSASLTGRKSNSLYDVVYVDLDMSVETARLPQVIDALSRYNFFTVVALNVVPADSFEAARSGFIYGAAPVSEVSMTVETIWLRDWTTQFMPDDLKRGLGIPVAAPGAAQPGEPPAG